MKLSGLVVVTGLAASVWGQVQIREVPGRMEFSGRVIARPLQVEELGARGLGPDEIGQTARQAEAVLAQYQEHAYEPLVDHHVIAVPEGRTEDEVIAELMATGLFEFVEPDWVVYPIACPDDTRFGSQWHHDADRMRSCDAWSIHAGSPSVTVGICDTGVQTNHPDLQLHRREGYNAVDRIWESQGGQIGPVAAHGTQTTGCAAANGDNDNGVSGTGWNLGHRMLRVSNSSSGKASISALTHAALTSIQAGDKVANVSYSGVSATAVRSTASTIKNLGGLLVWSGGNDAENLNWGNRDSDDVIVVGATTSGDGKASFSAYGRSVDLVAPGSSVYTTTTGSGYGSVSGTSFSAPLTAGLVALIWSHNPALTPDEVEAILKAGCDDLGAQGADDTYGHGRINSYESLLLAGGIASIPLPFDERFEQLSLDGDVWGANSGAVVGNGASNEPSAPYALQLDRTDSVQTQRVLLGDAPFPTYLSFWTQHRGVEAGKKLVAEYRNDSGEWVAFETITSDGPDQGRFQFHQNHLIFDAYHDTFALRFRAVGGDSSDDWYIDDVHIGDEVAGCIADFNADSSTDTQDVIRFFNAWSAGDDAADINGDGSVNSQDAIAFLNVWNAGC